MNKIVLNTGLWSAIICLAAFVVWIVSFVGIAIQSPLFFWTNIEGYIDYINNNDQFFQYLAKSFMIVFSLAYMTLSMALYEFTSTERKILAKIAIVFSIMFVLLSSIHYFVQISSVSFAVNAKNFSGLEHFIQSNPTSFISSINMLGWTLFLGLSTFFFYLGFQNQTGHKGLRLGLLITGISCLLGAIGYLSQIDLVTFVSMNLGIGLGFILITVSSIRLFKSIKREQN